MKPAGVYQHSAPPLAFGIDVLELARAQDLLTKFGSAMVQRVSTDDEAAWVGSAPERLGAVLGLKEAAIKAMSGRPEPFRWQLVQTGLGGIASSLEAVVDRPSGPGGVPEPVREVLRSFAAGCDLPDATAVTCRLVAGAQARLEPQLAGDGELLGIGCYGMDDENLYAAVCFWRDSEA